MLAHLGVTGLSRIRHELARAQPEHREPGKTEDLAEGVAELRQGQTAGFDEEVGQMLAAFQPRQGGAGASNPVSPIIIV